MFNRKQKKIDELTQKVVDQHLALEKSYVENNVLRNDFRRADLELDIYKLKYGVLEEEDGYTTFEVVTARGEIVHVRGRNIEKNYEGDLAVTAKKVVAIFPSGEWQQALDLNGDANED